MESKEVEIVKYFLSNKEESMNINRLAKGLKMDYKNAYNIIKRLQKKGIINLEMFGKSCKIILNAECHPIIFEAEYERRQEILKNKNIKLLVEYFHRNMKSRFYVMLLFGSYAGRKNTKDSDIDLLFVVPDKLEDTMEKNIQSIASMIPLKLHVNIFKEKDFTAMKNSREKTVGSEAIKNNIILHSIETYYEMIQ